MRFLKFILINMTMILTVISAFAQDDIDAIPQARPRPMPASVTIENNITIERYFTSIKQGSVGLVRLTGPDIIQAQLSFLNNHYSFFEFSDNEWYSFLVANMDIQPRDYEVTISIERQSSHLDISQIVTVESANYITQEFDMLGDLAELVDPELESDEFSKIDAIIEDTSFEILWDAMGFDLPLDSQVASGFGTYRLLNQSISTRHTGWDQQASMGTAIKAVATGKVVFAGELDIRGNYVMVDHGYGVYSGYAHLSQIHVIPGQTITKGQIVGMSGNTGRSGGAHLHWEMLINGEWIDSRAFMKMWLPS